MERGRGLGGGSISGAAGEESGKGLQGKELEGLTEPIPRGLLWGRGRGGTYAAPHALKATRPGPRHGCFLFLFYNMALIRFNWTLNLTVDSS